MHVKLVCTSAASSIVVLLLSVVSPAATIAVVDSDFQNPALGGANYAYPLTDWQNSDSGGSDGVFKESAYGLSASLDPHGLAQAGYINGWVAQQIGTVAPGATYTFSFYTSTDGSPSSTTIELVDGSPTGTVLTTSTGYLGPKNIWTEQTTPALTAVGGTVGDPLYVEFVHASGGQTFITGVSGIATPEPSSLILCGLAAVCLLGAARIRRRA